MGCMAGTLGQPHPCPVHSRRGLHWQELEGGGLALLRGSGTQNDQTLLGAHHAATLGHSDCCLQVVPWSTWVKVRVQLPSRGANLTQTRVEGKIETGQNLSAVTG